MPHVVVNGWFLSQPRTGSGQYLLNLLRALPEAAPNWRVTVVAPQRVLDAVAADALPESIQRHSVGGGTGHLAKVWFEQIGFPTACRKLKADVAHVPYWGPPLSSPAPVVCTIHDVIPLLLPEHRGGWRVQLYTALVSVAARGVSEVIADSRASQQDIITHLGLPEERVSVVYLAAEARYHPRVMLTPAIREKYNLPENYVLYLGGFMRRKNVHQLIAAWTWVAPSLGEQFSLVIAGALPDQPDGRMFYDLPALVEELKLTETVRFIGAVEEADKPQLYAGAELFVFPSAYEGFGLPPLEAMACGVPVLTTDRSSLGEVVGNAAYLIPDPEDARLMGAGIIALIVNGDLRTDLQMKGKRQAATFSWQKTATETVAIYQRALAAK